MPYRKTSGSVIWHWCHQCAAWPLNNFWQREDKPPTWSGQSLCEECATMRTGPISDRALEAIPSV